MITKSITNGIAALDVEQHVGHIKYVQAGDVEMPVLVEDLGSMTPKVIVSSGMLKTLLANQQQEGFSTMRSRIADRIRRAQDHTELVTVLVDQADFYTNVQLLMDFYSIPYEKQRKPSLPAED